MTFRKSSHSMGNGNCVEAAGDWAKPGRCASNECAEVRAAGGMVLVRDSKDKAGPVLAFTPAEWVAFTAAVKAG